MKTPSKSSPDTVLTYIESLKEDVLRQDTHDLVGIVQTISASKPEFHNEGTLGFGSYLYRYESGREGDAFILGFYPRKDKITIYLMDGTSRYTSELAKLGKHTTTGYCIYIKHLSDIHVPVLKTILQRSYELIRHESSQGPIDRILWKDPS